MDDITVRHFTAARRDNEKPHDIVQIYGKGRTIEVAVSHSGRSVRVWVDGEHMEARHG
jgi:hypothetical protein